MEEGLGGTHGSPSNEEAEGRKARRTEIRHGRACLFFHMVQEERTRGQSFCVLFLNTVSRDSPSPQQLISECSLINRKLHPRCPNRKVDFCQESSVSVTVLTGGLGTSQICQNSLRKGARWWMVLVEGQGHENPCYTESLLSLHQNRLFQSQWPGCLCSRCLCYDCVTNIYHLTASTHLVSGAIGHKS